MKKFILYITLFSLPVLFVIGWFNFHVKPHIPNPSNGIHGNLARMMMIPLDSVYATRELINDTLKDDWTTYCDWPDNIPTNDTSILFFGDSFNGQGKRGYINYFAHYANKRIWKLSVPENCSATQGLIALLNSDRLPKTVVNERVECHIIEDLCNTDLKIKIKDLDKDHYYNTHNNIGTNKFTYQIEIISKSVAQSQEWVKKRLSLMKTNTKLIKTKQDLFGQKGHENDLYFYAGDLISYDDEDVHLAALKFDSICDMANKKGIELYCVIAADKYSIYQSEIVNNPYPKHNRLQRFMSYVKHKECVLNSAELLVPMVQAGEKDVYYCDDTHWSQKAAKVVGRRLYEMMVENGSIKVK